MTDAPQLEERGPTYSATVSPDPCPPSDPERHRRERQPRVPTTSRVAIPSTGTTPYGRARAFVRQQIGSLSAGSAESTSASLSACSDLHGPDVRSDILSLLLADVTAGGEEKLDEDGRARLRLLGREVARLTGGGGAPDLASALLPLHAAASNGQALVTSLGLNKEEGVALLAGLSAGGAGGGSVVEALEAAIVGVEGEGSIGKLPFRALQGILHLLKSDETLRGLPPSRIEDIFKRLRASNGGDILHLSGHTHLPSPRRTLAREPPPMSRPDMSRAADRIRHRSDAATFVADLGQACTRDAVTLRDALREAGGGRPVDDRGAAGLLCFFADVGSVPAPELDPGSAHGGEGPDNNIPRPAPGGWDLDVVRRVLPGELAHADWDAVARAFDRPGPGIRDVPAFSALLGLYRACAGRQLPASVVTAEWENAAAQLSLLEAVSAAPPQVHVLAVDAEGELDAAVGSGCPNRFFASADVLRRLLALSDTQHGRRVRDIFIRGLQKSPETLFCALVRSGGDARGHKMRADLLAQLVSIFFRPGGGRLHAAALMRRLYATSPGAVAAACTEAWRGADAPARPAVASHIASLLRSVPEACPAVLSGPDHDFSVASGLAAADVGAVEPEPWLCGRIAAAGAPFASALVAHVRRGGAGAAGAGCVPAVLRALQGAGPEVLARAPPGGGASLGETVAALAEACAREGRAPVPAPSAPAAGPHGDDIEEMADSYLQKIYTSEQSISEVVEMLKKFKTSGSTRDNEIFACMIHNLFDEYRFFAKYPEKELRITGILFGTLIQEQLVSSITLGIALRYVLEALRKPPGPQGGSGKMFRFGMFALEQFKGRLHEWPQYCSHIVQIPHLKGGQPDLVAEIERAMAEGRAGAAAAAAEGGAAAPDVPVSEAAPTHMRRVEAPPVPTVPLPVAASAPRMSMDALLPPPRPRPVQFGLKLGRAVTGAGLETEHRAPPDNVLDRVQFIINNLSMNNVDQKVGELKDVIAAEFFGWLGQYLVVKRISTQPNFHGLYLAFLDKLGDFGRGLVEAILQSVYLGIGKLLRSPKITTSTSERSLLKNLGSWLGSITLARNKPILQKMLDCKELLFQGYETGRLIAVTPFVAKILEGARNSAVFRPPNPWVMGLLSVFRCLYGVDDLKMNIKFEVEVLCKNLNVKLEDIGIRDNLSSRVAPAKEKNPDFNIKSAVGSNSNGATPAPGVTVGSPEAKPTPAPAPPPSEPGSDPAPVTAAPTPAAASFQEQTVIPNLASYVTISPSISLFGATPGLKRVVPIAVDRAIREIIQPVVERSVTIACITTKELITKDYAMESDENKMRKAAQLMVSNLAGSLALVTCKEPLRASISSHLKQLLSAAVAEGARGGNGPAPPADEKAVDQVVSSCSNDNLELGCMLIEKAATEKALRDVDEALAGALQTRRKHREQTGQPYYDTSIFGGGRYPAALPEPLRPAPGGPQGAQLAVYDAFQRMPRLPVAPGAPEGQGTAAGAPPAGAAPGGAAGPAAGTALTSSQGLEALSAVVAKLDNAISSLLAAGGSRAGSITFSMIPADHEVRKILEGVKLVTARLPVGNVLDEAVLSFAQGVFKRMYDLSLSEPLRLEVFIALLQCLDEVCPKLSKEIGTWVTYAPMNNDNQKKLNRTILLLLVRSKLVKITDLDIFITRSMADGRNTIWIEFAILFVRTAVMEKIAALEELSNIIETLSKIGERSGSAYQKRVALLMDELRSGRPGPSAVEPSGAAPSDNTGQPQPPGGSLGEATKRAAESIAATARGDPQQTRQQVTFLLENWIRVYTETPGNEKAYAQYLQLLQQHGVGKGEDQTERFFRVSTELVVEAVLKAGSVDVAGKQKMLNFGVVDAYAKLVTLLIRYMNGGGAQEQVAAQRIALLNKVLGITVRTLMANYERSKGRTHWDQRPWFRLLLNLVFDLNAPSPALDPISLGILSVFGSAFHVVQPSVIPGFASAWLELISHRMFLPNLLLAKGQKGWAIAHQLLIDLFLFMEPYLRKAELSDAIKALYKGSLRVLLLLIHDFPSFLADYHLSFCNVIPENCVHLRNIILSAIPRGMTFPDPFTPNLKIDLLPEIQQNPRILSNVAGPLASIRADLDSYLNNRQPSNFVQDLLPKLYKDGKNEIDTPRVHSLVLYVGMQAISRLQNSQIAHTPEIEVLQKLMEFDEKGRYISLNAIANNLRYPSSHTHYFSCVMLFLFSEAKDDGVKEQVTRVLLERLIVNRPHPWGLLITFIELIKNTRYQFWQHPFIRCATEIEKLFESVARSCMAPQSQRSVSTGDE